VPIVALTGHRSGGFVERAMEAGAVAHVLKPFHEAHLVGTITDALAERDLRDEAKRRRDLIMIESMVRQGYSEREITDALNGRDGWAPTITFASWIRALFRR
jgi:FixJ family two-component response regulator